MLGLYLLGKAFVGMMKVLMIGCALMLLICVGVVLATLAVVGLLLLATTTFIMERRTQT